MFLQGWLKRMKAIEDGQDDTYTTASVNKSCVYVKGQGGKYVGYIFRWTSYKIFDLYGYISNKYDVEDLITKCPTEAHTDILHYAETMKLHRHTCGFGISKHSRKVGEICCNTDHIVIGNYIDNVSDRHFHHWLNYDHQDSEIRSHVISTFAKLFSKDPIMSKLYEYHFETF